MANWHTMNPKEVLQAVGGSPERGLGAAEATQRLQKHGKNEYAQQKKDGIFTMVLHQFRDVANVILLLAGVLSLALAIREGHGCIEPVVIFAIIFMNFALSISQERSSEKALEALQNLNSPSCLVLRDGAQLEIETALVVPGDILLLKTGDLVAADARILQSVNLCVDESSLTGESEPVEKNADALLAEDAPLGDQINMAFSGCLVTAGNAVAVVTDTGMHTQMGKIAGYLNNAQKLQTPLQKRLNKLSRMVSILAVVSALVLLAEGFRQGEEFWGMMLAAVSLAVAAVPETLQLIVTLTLTQGVKNMVKKNALIRKLPAVETLGNVSVICSDKTGTLTQNRMAIQKLWLPGTETADAADAFSPAQTQFLRRLALASNAVAEQDENGETRIIGDATESAIVRLLLEKGENRAALDADCPRVAEIPFSSARKMMSSVHKLPQGGYLLLTKGAFDRLPFADSDEAEIAARRQKHDEFAAQALRVIAMGCREIEAAPADGNWEPLESGLTFAGIIGLIDPPRAEAAQAIAVAKKAGIRTVMITGDHAGTAKAIAAQIGLLSGREKVLTGSELAHIGDEELVETVADYSVYARVSPEDKIRIVEAWQENGAVAAMTGDGVNDAPALKAADVGVAMGQAGTEVAKSASDMVLTDDNFASIVSAVREGRNVFANIRKTIYFLLVCNLSEIAIMLTAQFLGWGLPLTPVMLLLINVLGDGVPGLQLSKEVSGGSIMKRKPIAREESFFGGGLLTRILQQTFAFSVIGLLAYAYGVKESHLAGQTLTFLVVAFSSILHIFTVRSRKSMFRKSAHKNPALVLSALVMLVSFAATVFLPFLRNIFGLAAMNGAQWAVVLGLSILPSILAEIVKLWSNRHETRLYKRRLVRHQSTEADD